MQIDALRRERGALLSSLHYTLDDLQPKYSCPDCKDTGYLDGNRKCHCFEQAGISLLYEQSGIGDRLERERFNTFDINRYSRTKSTSWRNEESRPYAASQTYL